MDGGADKRTESETQPAADAAGAPVAAPADVAPEFAKDKLKVFVSYSRVDLAFADELAAGLEIMGFAPLIDRHAIREGEDWQTRLGNLITEAGTVVFVLSPDSARSSVCEWEVEHAHTLSKRIMPVLWRGLHEAPLGRQRDGTPWPEGPAKPPARLGALNYVHFEAHEDGRPRSFMDGLKALSKALNTDLKWLDEHTRLLNRALEWERGGKTDNRLMSGGDIAAARKWETERPANAPELTTLHLDYIKASEDAEALKLDAAKKQLEEREQLAREREEAAKQAEMAQQDRLLALAQAETAAKETARTQQRVGRLLWGVLALVLVMLGGAIWQSLETQKRESLVMLSAATRAIEDQQHEKAMRLALRAIPSNGALLTHQVPEQLVSILRIAAVRSSATWATREGSTDIRLVKFNQQGTMIVAVSSDGIAKLWDVARSQSVRQINGNSNPVLVSEFSPDGRYLATGHGDGQVKIWHTADTSLFQSYHFTERAIESLRFSESGSNLLVTADERVARVVLLTSGTVTSFSGHTRSRLYAAQTRGSQYLFTAAGDGVLRKYEIATGQELAAGHVTMDEVTSIAVDRFDNKVLTTSTNGKVVIWSALTGQKEAELLAEGGKLLGGGFHPTRETAVSYTDGGKLQLWDLKTHALERTIQLASGSVQSVAIDESGTIVAVATQEYSIRLISLETGELVKVLTGHTSDIRSIAFSQDAGTIVSASSDGEVRLWQVESPLQVSRLNYGGPIRKIIANGAAETVLIITYSGVMGQWRYRTGEFKTIQAAPPDSSRRPSVWSASVGPDGRYIGVVLLSGMELSGAVWNTQTENFERLIEGENGVVLAASVGATGEYNALIWDNAGSAVVNSSTGRRAIGETRITDVSRPDPKGGILSPNGRSFFSPGNAKSLQDFETLKAVPLAGARGGGDLYGFSKGGEWFLGVSGGRLWVWNSVTGAVLLSGQTDVGTRIRSWNTQEEQGLVLAVGGKGGTLWKVGNDQPWNFFNTTLGQSLSGAISTSGRYVVIGYASGQLSLWDRGSSREIVNWKAHERSVTSVEFASNDHEIFSGSSDGTVAVSHIGDVGLNSTGELVDWVCSSKLIGAQEFTTAELADPILSNIDPNDPVARNPCLRRGPLHWEYYTQAFDRWVRWGKTVFARAAPAKDALKSPSP